MSVQHSPTKSKQKTADNNVIDEPKTPFDNIESNEDVSFTSCVSPFPTDGVRSVELENVIKKSGNFKLLMPPNFELNRIVTRQYSASLNNLAHSGMPKKRKCQTGSSSSLDGVYDEFSTLFAALQKSYEQIDGLIEAVQHLSADNVEIKKKLDDLTLSNQHLTGEIISLRSDIRHNKPASKTPLPSTSNIPATSTIQHDAVNIDSNLTVSIPPSFADVTKRSSNVVIIRPKDSEQESKKTMSAIKSKISPTKKNIIKVKNVSKGGVIIECGTKDDIADLKTDAENKLGDNYDVLIPEKKLPKLRVFGISDKMTADEILTKLREQNATIFHEKSFMQIFTVTAAANSERYVFKMECDPQTFTAIMSVGKLRIGWDICVVQEIVDVLRCFNCNTFGHPSKYCKEKLTCPKCSGDHSIGDCKSEEAKCINCVSANRDLNMNLDTSHFVWSAECSSLKRQSDRQRKKINYIAD